jgi:cytochrome c553
MRWALMVVAVAACSTGLADPPKQKPRPPVAVPLPPAPLPPTPRPPTFDHDNVVRFHMSQNFDLLRAIERLLIRGKLDEARVFAEAIATAPDEPAHGPWATQTLLVRDRAAALARATTVDDALRKETALATACGSCHRELAVTGIFKDPPPAPPDRATLDARMARHRWAADRLWEGVVGNSDEAWQAGLDVIAVAPLDLGEERAPLARTLQQLASKARRTKPAAPDRGTAYADLLVTCAACHTLPRK